MKKILMVALLILSSAGPAYAHGRFEHRVLHRGPVILGGPILIHHHYYRGMEVVFINGQWVFLTTGLPVLLEPGFTIILR